MAKKPPKAKAIALRVTDEVREAAEKACKVEVRSLSGLVEKVLIDWLRERGYLK